jgi:hypothetical protein
MAIVDSTTCEAPGRSGSPVDLQERYENFGGQHHHTGPALEPGKPLPAEFLRRAN